MKMFVIILLLSGYILINKGCNAEETSITVRIKNGEIVGKVKSFEVNGTSFEVSQFLGLPYAEPPVGGLRFKKPQPFKRSFAEPFPADTFGNVCPQALLGKPTSCIFLNTEAFTISEDCLFLNVYVPGRMTKHSESKGKAVIVFLHIGGFRIGSGNIYASNTLASFGDVIVVTINYRLSVFGFFTTGDEHAPGNVGLWDQQLALQWVHDNIAEFGGDRKRVTVFGAYSGASSAVFQAMFPGNDGLMHRFISESGTALVNDTISHTPEVTTAAIAAIFHCNDMPSESIVACLQNIQYEDLLTGIYNYNQENVPPLRLGPTLDGEFLRQKPNELLMHDTIERKMFQSYDAMIGANSHEGGFAVKVVARIADIDNYLPDGVEMATKLAPFCVSKATGTLTEELLKIVVAHYTNWSSPFDSTNIRMEFVKMYGDIAFAASAAVLANAHCNVSETKKEPKPTYFYTFSARPSYNPLPTPSWLPGANHGSELAFQFGFDPEIFGTFSTTPESWEIDLAFEMIEYLSNFAKTGNPNSEHIHPIWPQYDIMNRKSIDISSDTYIDSFPFARAASFWYDVIPTIQGPSSCTSTT